jgi:hypothetical protein
MLYQRIISGLLCLREWLVTFESASVLLTVKDRSNALPSCFGYDGKLSNMVYR